MAETSFAWQTELTAARPHEAVAAADDARSPLERQAAVLTLLRSRSGAAPLSAQAIAHQLGADRVDLDEDAQVDAMVRKNPRVRVTFDDEMRPKYEYVSAHGDVHDAASLVAFVEQQRDGVQANSLHDAYVGAARDIERAIVAGSVLGVKDASRHRDQLFPRGRAYMVKVAGDAKYSSSAFLATTKDIRAEVRRGDAVRCREGAGGGPDRWFRVGSRVYGGSQPKRAERPLSASSLKMMHSANDYADPYDAESVPIAPVIAGAPPVATLSLAKHGCTNDVRALWLESAAETPTDRALLERKLTEAQLQGARTGGQHRKRARHQSDDKKKRRRAATKFERLTNTHLRGTPIGEVLQAALEGSYGDSATGGSSNAAA